MVKSDPDNDDRRPNSNAVDCSPENSKLEQKFLAARREAKMLAAVAGGFLALVLLSVIFYSMASSEAAKFIGPMPGICFMAFLVIGVWSTTKFYSVKNPNPPPPRDYDSPLPWLAILAQILFGFALGVSAWLTFGVTVIIAIVLVVLSIRFRFVRTRYFVMATVSGVIFPFLLLILGSMGIIRLRWAG